MAHDKAALSRAEKFRITGHAVTDALRLDSMRPSDGKNRFEVKGQKTPYAIAIDRVNKHYGGWRKFKQRLREQEGNN